MKVSFDPAKDEKNKAERGLSLAIGADVIKGQVDLVVDTRHDYGESRLVSYGYVGGRLFVCVYTVRGETVHIISLRKANDREVRKHGR